MEEFIKVKVDFEVGLMVNPITEYSPTPIPNPTEAIDQALRFKHYLVT
jgi:hypothetical protein